MTHSLEATFDGQVFRPAEAVDLEPNTRVQLVVTVKAPEKKGNRSFLDLAGKLEIDGPADWSSRVDDYLYGGEKMPGDE